MFWIFSLTFAIFVIFWFSIFVVIFLFFLFFSLSSLLSFFSKIESCFFLFPFCWDFLFFAHCLVIFRDPRPGPPSAGPSKISRFFFPLPPPFSFFLSSLWGVFSWNFGGFFVCETLSGPLPPSGPPTLPTPTLGALTFSRSGPTPLGPRPFGPHSSRLNPSALLPSSGGPPGLHFFWVWAPTFLIFIMLLICSFFVHFKLFLLLVIFFWTFSLFLLFFCWKNFHFSFFKLGRRGEGGFGEGWGMMYFLSFSALFGKSKSKNFLLNVFVQFFLVFFC